MDEEIIKNRLAVDERPLKNLIKRYLAWAKALERSSVEDAQNNFEFVLIQLAQYELAMMRHQLIHDMNEREVKHYEEECARIDQEVAEARHDIVKLQIELEKAQQARSNKIEYDVLANDINKHQSREKSHMIINQLNTHIRTLEREKATYATTFELRKKQFHALIAGVHELQDSIKEEREKGDEITAIMLNMEDALDVDGGGGGGGATPLPIQAPSPALLRVGSMGVGEGAASAQEDGEDEEGMVVESDGRRGSTDEGGDMMDTL